MGQVLEGEHASHKYIQQRTQLVLEEDEHALRKYTPQGTQLVLEV
jgi:hypothetical protein